MSGKYRPSLSSDEMELIKSLVQDDMLHCMQSGDDTAMHMSIVTRLNTALRKDASYYTTGARPGPKGPRNKSKVIEQFCELDSDIAHGKDKYASIFEQRQQDREAREAALIEEINSKAPKLTPKEALNYYSQLDKDQRDKLVFSVRALAIYQSYYKKGEFPENGSEDAKLYNKGLEITLMGEESINKLNEAEE